MRGKKNSSFTLSMASPARETVRKGKQETPRFSIQYYRRYCRFHGNGSSAIDDSTRKDCSGCSLLIPEDRCTMHINFSNDSGTERASRRVRLESEFFLRPWILLVVIANALFIELINLNQSVIQLDINCQYIKVRSINIIMIFLIIRTWYTEQISLQQD